MKKKSTFHLVLNIPTIKSLDEFVNEKSEFCKGSYTQKSNLKDHVLKSHPEKVPSPLGSGHFLP